MALWIGITFVAAFLQNVRSALQKRLTGRLSVGGATYARFLFAFPLAGIYVLGLNGAGAPLPVPHLNFVAIATIGGLGQIVGTFALVALFQRRNFAVGNAFSKTETLQAALFGLLFLGEALTWQAMLAIMIGVLGIVALSTPPNAEARFDRKNVMLGLLSGAGFGVAAVSYRAAALSLGDVGFLMQAGFTLMTVVGLQTLMMTAWLALREGGEIMRVLRLWRVTGLVSLVGVLSSIGWFTAMALENAALVRAVGQVELIFSIASARFVFGEKISMRELGGVVLVGASILIIVLAHG